MLYYSDGLFVDPKRVKTNMVFFQVTRSNMTSQELVERFNIEGVRLLPTGPKQLRAVTNYHVTPDQIEHALGVFRKVLSEP